MSEPTNREPEGESLGHYEMLWNCPFCGATKLLGLTHRYCPQCGAPQDPTTRYFPSDAEKVRVEDHEYVGADRTCSACNAPQSARAQHCAHCGAPLEGASPVQRFAATPPPKVAPVKKKRRWWLVALVIAVFFSVFYVFCLWKKTADMTVADHRWERAVAIEEYRDVTKEAWRSSVPLSARGVSCHREQRDTKQIPDGENCRTEKVDKGDGTFQEVRKCTTKYRSEPVYDEKCRYLSTEWTRVDEAVSKGQGLVDQQAWPATGLGTAQQARQAMGSRREGPRRSVYTLTLTEPGGKRHDCTVSEAVWRKYADGKPVKVQVKALTGGLDCDSIK